MISAQLLWDSRLQKYFVIKVRYEGYPAPPWLAIPDRAAPISVKTRYVASYEGNKRTWGTVPRNSRLEAVVVGRGKCKEFFRSA